MPSRDDPPETRRTLPKLPPRPSVMGVRIPPRAHPSDEPTRNDLPTGRHRPPQPTQPGLPAPPPPSGDTTLQSATEAEVTPISGHERPFHPPPRQDAHREAKRPGAPNVRASIVDAYEAELERKAPKHVPSIEPPRSATPSSGQPATPYSRATIRAPEPVHVVLEQPWWRTAKGVAVAVPVIVAGLGGLTPAVVLPIIKAVREPYEGAKAKDIAEAKAASERAETAAKSEQAARQAKVDELAKAISDEQAERAKLAERVPAVKPDPNRRPR